MIYFHQLHYTYFQKLLSKRNTRTLEKIFPKSQPQPISLINACDFSRSTTLQTYHHKHHKHHYERKAFKCRQATVANHAREDY
ncbi:hypothetical protein Psal006b_01190 [Piscirickettsia salmonis]|uniref:Transposase n=1 Tax=Piscirickettsia salmonis TaxID=1238 RepID=A0AAC8ZP89_PISSA|nr:hypothetical protein [Piscirickettsia salmonis]ALB23193.1 transposase [Piscirickettsia salmonis]ALY03119.1 hypothetical protein AWE47_09895 [Piscirickettsia salmonis]AMA42678.1 hypothetical protein AWJ11_10105 [Piscirickettsia salmonis]AOS35150.1 hypothetical protein AVM72_07245 [Piscirickettsia salmonis]APS59855.1 hypothetical protein AVI53_04170 [Piscirickettsia salmonis]